MELHLGTAKQANASEQRGWVAGHFAPDVAQTRSCEIKVWHYDRQPEYPAKRFDGTEFIIVEGGALTLDVEHGGREYSVLLDGERREYVILPPGTTKRVSVTRAPAFGTCVRWPSAPETDSGE